MIIRSLLFNVCFFAWALIASILFLPLFVLSAKTAQMAGRPWAQGALYLARLILGLSYEVRGRQYLTDQPAIYASKHQSAWDTIIFLILLARPAYVLKRELLLLPGWGWYLWRMKMIAIDRSAGAASIKKMIRESKLALAEKRSIVIYPEGTRTRPGSPPRYQPGVVAMYQMLAVPVVPVALNSGCYWGKDAFMKRRGTILIEFLPPIAPGLDKATFNTTLQHAIENASARLEQEATSQPSQQEMFHAPIR
jgi:1-acyl-sn-glycerol-3-phosphate acyltransferase